MSEVSQSIQDDIRDSEPGWCATPARCGLCGHVWAAVWPLNLDRLDPDSDEALDEGIAQLECPNCGQQGHTVEDAEVSH